MRIKKLDPRGMGFLELLFWAALLGLLAWAVWQFYLHPEGLNAKPESHHPYEDTRPSN